MANFFLWCAGTSRELLKTCTEVDAIRQQQLGAHVFFTSALAFFSSWFALGYVVEQESFTLIFATLWSIMIFLLDRTLIVSPVLTYQHPASSTYPKLQTITKMFRR